MTTPEFAGVTFHEVLAKSALNKVPGAAAVPFDWTINPYRGCGHACTYCFARRTHSYLELDTGRDFDSQIVVKINIVAVLQRELARPSWRGEPVALGTNTDPYQRAEGRYRLMPGIARALAESGTPFSILTKGTTLRRDLPLLSTLNGAVPIGAGVSLALDDEAVHAALEPGTPTPARPPGSDPRDRRSRPELSGAGRPGAADDHRQRRAAGSAARQDRGRRCQQCHRVRAAPAAGRPGVVLVLPDPAPSGAGRCLRRAVRRWRLRAALVRGRPGSAGTSPAAPSWPGRRRGRTGRRPAAGGARTIGSRHCSERSIGDPSTCICTDRRRRSLRCSDRRPVDQNSGIRSVDN